MNFPDWKSRILEIFVGRVGLYWQSPDRALLIL